MSEQSRAAYPDEVGTVTRDGVSVAYEVYGSGVPTFLLMPTWSVVHSRVWKMQIPYLARHARVVTFDGRGNGRSARPAETAAYDEVEFARDAAAVLAATGTGSAVVVAFSLGAQRAVLLADEFPALVEKLVLIGPAWPVDGREPAERSAYAWDEPLDTEEGWARYNKHYWRRDYRGFLEFFFGQVFVEPHSTKQIEDCVGWGLETTPEVLIAAETGRTVAPEDAAALAARISCPTLVVHGSDDRIVGVGAGEALADQTGGSLVVLAGSGHAPHARDPVAVNHLIRDFALPPPRTRRWSRGAARPRRALFLSSPIGLGHAQRDLAIARELRMLRPDLQIDWLAQHPVTRVLTGAGERIHPASRWLTSESAHIESESAEHDLHCFQAIRRMDEILLSNFMVFDELMGSGDYDLCIGDEAWEVDHYLHENPEIKRAPYVWLTDFVGWLPMPDGGSREEALTTDYNAEMIGHIERFPRLRDRAVFVGDPEDVVPGTFGTGLPDIDAWTREHYDFAGYVTGFDPSALDREELRHEFGWRPDELVCLVTVGGSGVGGDLLRRVTAAYPLAKERVPGLRMVVVTGPRIDPATLPAQDGLEMRAFVPELYRRLAACDLAVVQGGLTTAMELTANGRPFLYFPLRHHFEQNFHVAHRLDRHRAGVRMEYATETPETIAAAIAANIGRTTDYRPVRTDGAAVAAGLIVETL